MPDPDYLKLDERIENIDAILFVHAIEHKIALQRLAEARRVLDEIGVEFERHQSAEGCGCCASISVLSETANRIDCALAAALDGVQRT